MTFDLLSPTPARKCVLIVNPDTPGIETLRWQQLAKRLIPQPGNAERSPHHPVEYREIPGALFSRAYHSLINEHGLAVAISCIHQTEDECVLVCTSEFFDRTVTQYLREVRTNAIALQSSLDHMMQMIVALEVLSATS